MERLKRRRDGVINLHHLIRVLVVLALLTLLCRVNIETTRVSGPITRVELEVLYG
jgi:hypothetical protein